jgi:hypothetical protein
MNREAAESGALHGAVHIDAASAALMGLLTV